MTKRTKRSKEERVPKAEYFRKRYANALSAGLTSKAEYYKGRLEELGEFLTEPTSTQHGALTRTEFLDGALIVYSW